MKLYDGSFIGVGLVYYKSDIKKILMCMKHILSHYLSEKYNIKTYFEKENLNKEYNVESIEKINFKKVLSADYFTIYFDSVCNDKTISLIMSKDNMDNFLSVQVDINEESLYNCIPRTKCLDYFEKMIIDLYKISPFCYAYCDNEATFEYTLSEFKTFGMNSYSIAFLPKTMNEMKIIRQKWNLDGYSERDKSLVGEFIVQII